MLTETYIKKIIIETGLNRKEIKSMVKEKIKRFKGLISEEGALCVVAKELGVYIKKNDSCRHPTTLLTFIKFLDNLNNKSKS